MAATALETMNTRVLAPQVQPLPQELIIGQQEPAGQQHEARKFPVRAAVVAGLIAVSLVGGGIAVACHREGGGDIGSWV